MRYYSLQQNRKIQSILINHSTLFRMSSWPRSPILSIYHIARAELSFPKLLSALIFLDRIRRPLETIGSSSVSTAIVNRGSSSCTKADASFQSSSWYFGLIQCLHCCTFSKLPSICRMCSLPQDRFARLELHSHMSRSFPQMIT